MKFNDLIAEQEKNEIDKNKYWQDTLNEYSLKLSSLNNWLIFERKKLINKYGAFYCPLPAFLTHTKYNN
jgi:hypothetical protein